LFSLEPQVTAAFQKLMNTPGIEPDMFANQYGTWYFTALAHLRNSPGMKARDLRNGLGCYQLLAHQKTPFSSSYARTSAIEIVVV
jgi:hypothetical protein